MRFRARSSDRGSRDPPASVAQIRFSPESQSAIVRFPAPHDGDMPHLSNELLDLASGALRGTIDLRSLRFADRDWTIESILSALGEHASEIEILAADPLPDPELLGSHHVG